MAEVPQKDVIDSSEGGVLNDPDEEKRACQGQLHIQTAIAIIQPSDYCKFTFEIRSKVRILLFSILYGPTSRSHFFLYVGDLCSGISIFVIGNNPTSDRH